eukprot:Opistho-2@52395
MSLASRSNVLSLYRQMIRQARLLGDAERRTTTLKEIRETFRANKDESDLLRIAELVTEAQRRVQFLAMLSPRAVRRGEQQRGRVTYVMRDGKLVEGRGDAVEGTAASNWGSGNPDPAKVTRHWALWDKQKRMGL